MEWLATVFTGDTITAIAKLFFGAKMLEFSVEAVKIKLFVASVFLPLWFVFGKLADWINNFLDGRDVSAREALEHVKDNPVAFAHYQSGRLQAIATRAGLRRIASGVVVLGILLA